jgi:hypothetical protein
VIDHGDYDDLANLNSFALFVVASFDFADFVEFV